MSPGQYNVQPNWEKNIISWDKMRNDDDEKALIDNEIDATDEAKIFIKSKLSNIIKREDFKTLGNARFIRKIVEKAKLNRDYRLGQLNKNEYTEDELKTIVITDIEIAIDDSIPKDYNKLKIGFVVA